MAKKASTSLSSPEPTSNPLLGRGELRVTSAVAAADSGRYDCVARNPYGETRRRVRLRVVRGPSPRPFRKRYLGRPGEAVEVPGLKAGEGTGVVSAVWKKDGEGIEFGAGVVMTETGGIR